MYSLKFYPDDRKLGRDERRAKSALNSWWLDYTNMDESYSLVQLTDNIALVEMVLKDKEHLKENADRLLHMVNELKIFALASQSINGRDITDYYINTLTPEEQRKVDQLEEAAKNRSR